MGTASDSERAREALLEAACEVFAENGYRRATVREICSRAGQNTSAINYHYGSKEGLYRQVLALAAPDRSGAVRASERAESGEGSSRVASPKLRLQGFISFFLAESLSEDEKPWKSRVLVHELAAPSEMFDDLVRTAIRPHFEALRTTVGELLGIPRDADGALQQLVVDHTLSTVGQVVFYRHSRPVVERVAGRRYGQSDSRRLADHIFRVVLAGISAERRRLRRRSRSDTERARELEAGPRIPISEDARVATEAGEEP